MSLQAFPFQRIDPALLTWSDWMVTNSRNTVVSINEAWNVNDCYNFTRTLEISEKNATLAGLAQLSRPRVLFTLFCPATFYRDIQSTPISKNQNIYTASLTVSGRDVSQLLQLEAIIVADVGLHTPRPLYAARLASSSRETFYLESASAMTTKILSFRRNGLGTAPWRIRTEFETESDNFASNMIVEVNSDYSIAARLERRADKIARWALMVDVIKFAITRLAEIATDTENEQLEAIAHASPASLTAAVRNYAFRQSLTIEQLLKIARDDPLQLDAITKEVAERYAPLK